MAKFNDEGYFQWLVSLVGAETNFAQWAYSIPYQSVHEDDMNRIEDGRELRRIWADSYRQARVSSELASYIHWFSKPVTVLEMMIALSSRMKAFINNEEYDQAFWFKQMYDNLDRGRTLSRTLPWEVVIHSMVRQDYGMHGENCLFPSKNDNSSLRYKSLWIQMNQWFLENYFSGV